MSDPEGGSFEEDEFPLKKLQHYSAEEAWSMVPFPKMKEIKVTKNLQVIPSPHCRVNMHSALKVVRIPSSVWPIVCISSPLQERTTPLTEDFSKASDVHPADKDASFKHPYAMAKITREGKQVV